MKNAPRKMIRQYASTADLPIQDIEDGVIANVGGAFYKKVSGSWILFEYGTFGETGTGTAAAILTIANGSITRSQMIHSVKGQGDANDELDTVVGAEVDGKITILRPFADAVDITIKHGTGNIECPDALDIVLAEDDDFVVLVGTGELGIGKAAVVAYKTKAASKAASKIVVTDAANYYTGTDLETILTELKTQLGGTTSTTYNFTNGTGTRLADNDAVYAALNKLDQGFVDLKSTANAKGASLVGIEDAGLLLAATDLETAVAELAKYHPIALADPGTGAAIPVTRSANIAITTAAAETNTLADPTFIGQKLILTLDVRVGGDRVITAASDVTETGGQNVMTFGTAGQTLVLEAVKIAGALKWRVTANIGNVVIN